MRKSTMERLRASNPASEVSAANEALFAEIVSKPGDRRLGRSASSKKVLSRRTRMVMVLGAVVIGSMSTVAATYPEFFPFFKGNPFSANEDAKDVWAKSEAVARQSDMRPGSSDTSSGEQNLIESSIGSLPLYVPDVGRLTFWHGKTEENGWCGALKAPNGHWLVSPIDRPELNMACQPPKDKEIYLNTGFNYNWDYSSDWVADKSNGINHSAAVANKGVSRWIIVSGSVKGTGPASSVEDTKSHRRVPVKDGWFAIAIPYTDDGKKQWNLVAYDKNGNVVAEDGKELPGTKR